MNSTTHYLYKAALTILDIWDEVAAIASPFVPIAVSPSPPPAASFPLTEDGQLIAPSHDLLHAADLFHLELLDEMDPALSAHEFIHGEKHPTRIYWKDTRMVVYSCVHFWMMNMRKEGFSLQEGFDDQERSSEEAAKLRAEVARKMRMVQTQPAFPKDLAPAP